MDYELYFALGIIALSFLVIIVSNRTYIAPAGRDLEIARISIALAIHSFDPTKDAISDSAEYKLYKRRHNS